MSRICLFAFFLILGIAVRFGDCEKNIYGDDPDCAPSPPGSDKSRVAYIFGDIFNRNNKSNTFQGSFSNVLKKASSYGLIFPGTLWCGDGDRAKNESDLGHFNDTDACCRAHDNCKNDIPAGGTKANLKNDGIFTKSACSCDSAFYNCLKKANSLVSKGIGETYFNILRPQCFECTCLTDGCNPKVDTDDCKNHCKKYKWVDNKKF